MATAELTMDASLKDAITSFREVFDDWVEMEVPFPLKNEAPHPMLAWYGNGWVKALSEGVIQAAHNLFRVLDQPQDGFTKEVHHTVLAADKFREAFEQWETAMEIPDTPADPSGSFDMRQTLTAMEQSVAPRRKTRVESPAELERQRVPHAQIAKIYGWRQPDGMPDIAKVEEELSKPGTHFDADTFVEPNDRQREDELAALWEKRANRTNATRNYDPQPVDEGSESLDEIVILPGMSMRQVAKIKPSATIQEILEACDRQGVQLPDAASVTDARPAKSNHSSSK